MKSLKFTFIILIISFGFLNAESLDLQKQFNAAKSMTNQYEFQQAFEDIFFNYPDTYYGQLSLLELAKIESLKRNYEKAISYLRKIHHPEIEDKEFWLAEAYLKINDYDTAIIAAQNYIFSSEDNTKIELAYFLIAESYMQKKNYNKAISTLEYLRNSEFISNNIPLLHFKLGMCYELKGDIDKALLSYKKLKKDFPYDQYTFQSEERIINLGNPTISETSDQKAQIDYKEENPTKERYLQVGVFGSKDNADKMVDKINNIMIGKGIIFPRRNGGKILHVVAAGPFSEDRTIKEAKEKLSDNNISSFEIKK